MRKNFRFKLRLIGNVKKLLKFIVRYNIRFENMKKYFIFWMERLINW